MLVELSANKIRFPPQCACCGEPADAEITVSASKSRGSKVVHTTTRGWSFPYCLGCLAHVRTWNQGDVGMLGFMCGGFVFGTAIWFGGAGEGVAMGTFAVGLIAALWWLRHKHNAARGMCSPTCAAPHCAVSYVGWSGSVHSFNVLRVDYAGAFMLANGSKLINVTTEARGAAAAVANERRAEAERGLAAARAARVEQEDAEALLRWVAKIESAKGTASRRAALDAGLKALTGASERGRLLAAYAKEEARAALDKADTLKSPAAKRRTLQAAIDALRASPVQEDVWAPLVAELERAARGE